MNFIQASILLIVYTFIIVTLYMVLSDPFDKIVTPLEDLNMSASDAHMDRVGGYVRTAFDISFALLIIVPASWFVFWVFHREPDWRYRQY